MVWGGTGEALAGREWIEPPKPAPLFSTRPAWPEHPVLCSNLRPICVHVRSIEGSYQLAPALEVLENVHARLVDVLQWRAPQPDLGYGPNDGFDLYLVPDSVAWETYPDPMMDTSLVARTSAYSTVDPGQLGTCYFDHSVSAAMAKAGIFAIDAAANEAFANATASYLGSVVALCPGAYAAGIDDFQLNPQRALSSGQHDQGRGAMLFPWFVQEKYGRGGPLDLLHAMWALAAQPSPEDSGLLRNEPDFADSVGIVATDLRRSLGDFWLDFAVARAFVGDRDNGLFLPTSRFLGELGAVRFEWVVDYHSLPRRLAPLFPVEPTGSSYLWVTLNDVPDGAGLGFRADWEAPDVFRFALLLIDDKGHIISRRNPVSEQRRTRLEVNLGILTGGVGVLIVACNTGSILRDIAFDPDNLPYVPRGYTVSLFAQ
ncbi:MAG: hypothetical protein CSA75_04780 [Sorangium cellulosum]|nr:MAG: hypothetical protein CSA75_04780 [Sorangium cellulosum]